MGRGTSGIHAGEKRQGLLFPDGKHDPVVKSWTGDS